jgi:hypothetical protein
MKGGARVCEPPFFCKSLVTKQNFLSDFAALAQLWCAKLYLLATLVKIAVIMPLGCCDPVG